MSDLTEHNNVIAIDGPAASGKSTIASMLAEKLGITYVNTGNMYRAVTLYAMQKGFSPDSQDAENIVRSALSDISLEYIKNSAGKLELLLNGKTAEPEIRSPEVAANVSTVAAMPFVREWLVDKQRYFAEIETIVMEGRDIGTVVFPDAKFKFFLTASPEIRAMRRLKQDNEAPEGATVAAVAEEIAKRDRMDMNRKTAPLKQAEDAHLIDTSNLTIDEIVSMIETIVV